MRCVGSRRCFLFLDLDRGRGSSSVSYTKGVRKVLNYLRTEVLGECPLFWLCFIACYEFIDCSGEVGNYCPLGIRSSGDGFKLAIDSL